MFGLATALVYLAALPEPPARFAAGADAVQVLETKAATLLAQAEAHRELVLQPRQRGRLSKVTSCRVGHTRVTATERQLNVRFCR